MNKYFNTICRNPLILFLGLYSFNIQSQETPLGTKIVGNGDPNNYYIGHYAVPNSDGLDLHWYGGIRFGDHTSKSVMQITNGKVGIGTTDPDTKLSINGNSTIIAAYGDWAEGLNIDSPNGIWGGLKFRTVGRNGINGNWHFGYDAVHSGTTTTGNNIYLYNGSNNLYVMTYKEDGNVGIGTKNPIEKLNINGGIGEGASFDTKMALTKTSSTGNIQSAKIVLNGVDSNWGNLVFKVKTTASMAEFENFYTDALTIKGSNANVGIGTSNPDEKLTVNGKIHAKEVRIDLSYPMTVPDYVFANDYKLKPLQEVEEFIKQNSHLPEIPSAKEIEKNGLMLAEMNMSLLKKIEELTLYSIEQEKKINTQTLEIEALKDLTLRVTKIENELIQAKN